MSEPRAIIQIIKAKLKREIDDALTIANSYLEHEVKYVLGGKSDKTIDCSGLIQKCYPDIGAGVENQYQQFSKWIFAPNLLRYSEIGDLIFFSKPELPTIPIHVGIITVVELNKLSFIHASERIGGLCLDHLKLDSSKFNDIYIILGIGKIRPFLFRCFLKLEIDKRIKNEN